MCILRRHQKYLTTIFLQQFSVPHEGQVGVLGMKKPKVKLLMQVNLTVMLCFMTFMLWCMLWNIYNDYFELDI
jgi:hypothetical protein